MAYANPTEDKTLLDCLLDISVRMANIDLLPSKETSRTPFKFVLYNRERREAFYKFMCAEHSEENLKFWMSCLRFKESFDLRHKSRALTFAREIYETFIVESAHSEVNIDYDTKKNILSKLGDPEPDMFDEARLEIEKLMEKDPFQRFLKSEKIGMRRSSF